MVSFEFSDLPTETWLHIAKYIPKSQLGKLKSLNSFFLACWLDIRWKRVKIDEKSPKRTLQFFQRVIDPLVAKRTNILSVDVADSGLLVMKPLIYSLLLLPNLTSLHMKLSPDIFIPVLCQVIKASSIKSTLQTLSLKTHVNVVASFSQNDVRFENLTELDLVLSNDLILHCLGGVSLTKPESSLTLAPFIRSLAPTLQVFRITSWSKDLDLTQLFGDLTQFNSPVLFTNLKSFNLDLLFQTFPELFLEYLHHFLIIHADKLQHLKLRLPTLPDFGPLALPLASLSELLGTWVAKLANTQFSSLQTLDMYPSSCETGLSAILTLIEQTSSTLSSLVIHGYGLTPEDADKVFDALDGHMTTKMGPSKLKGLSIHIEILSVPFLEVLARRFPQLERLRLIVSKVVGSDQHSFYELLQHRRDSESDVAIQDILKTWKLRKLTIFKSASWDLMGDAVRAVASVVPSIVVCDGRDEFEDDYDQSDDDDGDDGDGDDEDNDDKNADEGHGDGEDGHDDENIKEEEKKQE